MQPLKTRLLSTAAALPLVLGLATGMGVMGGLATGTTTLAACNPCAAKKPCNPCNPCTAKACNPCNPCSATAAAVSRECFVPRLQKAAACNPCAAKNPCNPCNPCAAKTPCNPCAASACNPCNPCAAAPEVELTAGELKSVYDCLKGELVAAYGKVDILVAKRWGKWKRFSAVSYRSDTHGGRFVNNYANRIAENTYGQFEKVKSMPVGSMLAKDSFQVNADGTVAPGALFSMEKMASGFNKETGDWRYAMVMPKGTLFGITGGKNSTGLTYCHDCHVAAAENDMMFFMPEEYRKK